MILRAVMTLTAAVTTTVAGACQADVPPPAAPVTAPLAIVPVPVARNPLLWPFASDSIWNTARGAAALLRPAGIAAPHVGLDLDYLVVTRASDPLTPTYDFATFGPGRCHGTRPQPQAKWHPKLGMPIHVPLGFVLPDAASHPYSTPNNSSAFLDPDGHTLHEFNATARCAPSAPLYGYRTFDSDIRGDGRLGGHLGSGLSSIGGDVRAGELFGVRPIDHALKVDVPPSDLNYAPSSSTPGFRWPASMADGYAVGRYRGGNPDLVLGSLLTIPTSVAASSLGLRTDQGRRLLAAFQNYGAYIADTTGNQNPLLCVDSDATADYRAHTGHDMASDPAFQSDLQRLFRVLQVVSNDGRSAIGGPGTRLAPPAPPLASP